MRLVPSTCLTALVIGLALALPAETAPAGDPNQTLTLTSSAFRNGGAIPERYTCSGQNESPELTWTGVPHGTRSLALILDDPDAPMGTFTHWVAYNLSPTTKGLPEGVPASASVGEGEQGINGRGTTGYTGPCPPSGKPHHYYFRLFALDERLPLNGGATAHQVEDVLEGHVLASAELIGAFQR